MPCKSGFYTNSSDVILRTERIKNRLLKSPVGPRISRQYLGLADQNWFAREIERMKRENWLLLGLAGMIVFGAIQPVAAQHQVVTLKNGLEYEGLFATIPEYSETIGGTSIEPGLHAIALVDDGLRRVFFNYKQIAQNPIPAEHPFQRIAVWQELSVGQAKTWRFGNLMGAEAFNDLGHRVITSSGNTGGGTFVQGITEITPVYTRVAALRDEDWVMRIATSSLPSDVLIKLLRRQIADPNSITKRLEIVDLLIQAKRYQDANEELKSVQQDFPDLTAEIAEKRQILSQQFARQVLSEIRTRLDNGQTKLAIAMTDRIKGPEVSAEILAEILAMATAVNTAAADIESAKQLLRQQRDLLIQDGKLGDEATAAVNVMVEEICNELNSTNLERLATFVRLVPDAEMTSSPKIAFALSGWIIGSGAAIDNMAVALALVEARRLTIEYLTTEDAPRRQAILTELETIEAGDPQYLAKIVQNLTPPLELSAQVNMQEPIELTVEIPGPAANPAPRAVKYFVQLPPEYDRYRRYPCIVALHSEGQSLKSQLEWWAGAYNPKLEMAMGQAARHGYIVLSPEWNQADGREYSYSAAEQMAVLKSLRDAMRRFAIDTDRVYLTGQFAGADAAWDLGLCFPDIWAGVVPISAFAGQGGKYAFRTHEVASNNNLPFLFVTGQHDVGRIEHNKLVWNKWMASPNFDVTVVEYQGRLAESFPEEIPNIFVWMARHRRNVLVEEFTGRTLRPWSRRFWWAEVDHIPAEDVVLPTQWPPKEKILPVHFDCKFSRAQNKFVVGAAKGSTATLWLLPDLVDFTKLLEISGRGADFRGAIKPSRQVLLEDVRRRADRQHPYWAKLVCERAKWQLE